MGNNTGNLIRKTRQSSGSSTESIPSNLSRESISYDSTQRIPFESYKKISSLNLGKIVGRPIRTKDNVIFLSQNEKNEKKQQEMSSSNGHSHGHHGHHGHGHHHHNHRRRRSLTPNENQINIHYYNVKSENICKCLEIDTSKYNINIKEASYQIHDESDTLYILNKNRELLAISLTDGAVHKLYDINPENTSNAKPKKSLNVATICIYDNKLLILGAVKAKKNDDNKVESDHIHKYIPYDLIKNKANEPHLVITNFGKLANVQCMKDSNYLLIMGGTTTYQEKIYPTNLIRQLKFKNNSINNYEFSELPLYLPENMTSFGCITIDLDENVRYIILFGGTYVHHRRKKIECSNSIYALYLDKRYEKLSNEQVTKLEEQLQNKLMKLNQDKKKKKKVLSKNKDMFDIKYHGQWLQLNYELPQKANYYAFYDPVIDKDTIHLLTHHGTHYTLSYQEMITILQKDSILEINDDGKLMTGQTCHYLNHPWTESGKNPIPTKIRLGSRGNPKNRRSRGSRGSRHSSSSKKSTPSCLNKNEVTKQSRDKKPTVNVTKIEEKEMDKIDEHEMY